MKIKRSDSVYITSQTTKERKQYCPICEKHKVIHQLHKRVYNDLELVFGQLPSDHDNWLQCFHCGNVFLKDNVRQEGKLTSSIHIPKSFSTNREDEKVEKPKHRRGFNERLSQEPEIKDPEVRNAIKKGHKLLNYSEQ